MTTGEQSELASLKVWLLRGLVAGILSNATLFLGAAYWVGTIDNRVAVLERTDAARADHAMEIVRLRTQMEGLPELRLELREFTREVRNYMNEQRQRGGVN